MATLELEAHYTCPGDMPHNGIWLFFGQDCRLLPHQPLFSLLSVPGGNNSAGEHRAFACPSLLYVAVCSLLYVAVCTRLRAHLHVDVCLCTLEGNKD